jgi:membrane-bound lytic murein transglycosylase D
MNTTERSRPRGSRAGTRCPDVGNGVDHRFSSSGTLFALFLGFLLLAALVGLVPAETSWVDDRDATTVSLDEVAPSDVPSLPLEMNDRVEYWLERFLTDQRPTFQQYLDRQGRYAPLIRERALARGLPPELLYLAMIESGFSPHATSKVAAVGLWQFMGPTAQQYGLRVDQWVDERRDPERATDAALDYLEWLHQRYGSWYLAAAAYNAGPGRVDQALRHGDRGRETDVDLYWEIIDHLPHETRHHVPRMIAATVLARNASSFGFRAPPDTPYVYDRVWVPGGTRLATLARKLDVSPEVLRELNPQLVQDVTPPGQPWGLRVPAGSSASVVAALGGDWGYAADD